MCVVGWVVMVDVVCSSDDGGVFSGVVRVWVW